jgi:hypothetical protein
MAKRIIRELVFLVLVLLLALLGFALARKDATTPEPLTLGPAERSGS